MEITETFYASDRKEWRAWLEEHHRSKTEIWLVRYKKHTGKPTVSYDDSVEEALCYGWIDSTVKKMDEERYVQRFTPRRKKSIWSAINIKRAKKVIDEGFMRPAGLDKIPDEVMEAIKTGKIERVGRVVPKDLPTPPELSEALDSNSQAKMNWESWTLSHRKMYIHWMTDAKRPETRERRMKRIIKMAEENVKALL